MRGCPDSGITSKRPLSLKLNLLSLHLLTGERVLETFRLLSVSVCSVSAEEVKHANGERSGTLVFLAQPPSSPGALSKPLNFPNSPHLPQELEDLAVRVAVIVK